ncbi:MAG: ornithine cyclodeaminase family protein [Pseudomonadota bacterium]|nr:ornithine cyclodeaminase family protein [Pseudomonadota bacterium]
MQIFDAATTRAALPFDALVPALRAAFAATATGVPPRHVHALGEGTASPGTVLIMPAWSEAFLGIKTINIFPANGARGLPGLHATYVLYDAATGVPLALMDGNEITARRTAGAAALGAAFLARPDARRLLVLGSGRVARLLPQALRSVRPGIDAVQVWNHRPEGAQALAAQWRAEGLAAQAVTDLEAAVRAADIVSCATLATTPLVQGAWLAPGAHLDLIGSFTPQMKEADPPCFGGGARVCVDTDEALRKAGDLLDAFAAGTLAPHGVHATLAQLCRGEREGRRDARERTVFKAVGTALEDLAAATLAWQSRSA